MTALGFRSVLMGLVAWILIWPGRPAHAWWFVEHEAIGTAGYRQACVRVKVQLEERGDAPDIARMRERFSIACSNLAVSAKIYGQSNALAGDRLDNPEDFLAYGGDWKVGSRRHYYLLQLVDVHHFHPASLRAWMEHHKLALTAAEQASHSRGLDAVDGFRQAFYQNAFADHFLQDAYAAGHMGFNRSASSIAATSVFHTIWNARGRYVRNRRGETWLTYGDNELNTPANQEGRKRVIEACAASAYGLVSTFVFGTRDFQHEMDIWAMVPYLITAPSMPALLSDDDEQEDQPHLNLQPLEAIYAPVEVDELVDVRFAVVGRYGEHSPIVATLLGFDVALPLLRTRARVSAGVSSTTDEISVRAVGQLAVQRQIGLSLDGLISHHLATGAMWRIKTDELAGAVHAAYSMHIELGRTLVMLSAGPAAVWPDPDLGYIATLGLGRVLGARGGGVR